MDKLIRFYGASGHSKLLALKFYMGLVKREEIDQFITNRQWFFWSMIALFFTSIFSRNKKYKRALIPLEMNNFLEELIKITPFAFLLEPVPIANAK